MQINFTALAVLLLATALSGCGGGGGEGGSSSVPPQPNIPDCDLYGLDCTIYNSYISQGLSHDQASERTQTLSIRMINADAAYDRGWTGAGVTIGFYEVEIDSSHPELNGKVVDNPYDEIEPGSYYNVIQTLDQAIEHAQSTAGVAIAKRNKIGMHGVAYDSHIEFVSDQNETFNTLIQEQYDTVTDLQDIEGHDARAINYLNSRVPIAFSAAPGFYDWSDATPEETETEGANSRSWLSALRQTSTAAANRTVWVYAAGNESKPYPIGAGYFPVHFPELSGHCDRCRCTRQQRRHRRLFKPLRCGQYVLHRRPRAPLRTIRPERVCDSSRHILCCTDSGRVAGNPQASLSVLGQ